MKINGIATRCAGRLKVFGCRHYEVSDIQVKHKKPHIRLFPVPEGTHIIMHLQFEIA